MICPIFTTVFFIGNWVSTLRNVRLLTSQIRNHLFYSLFIQLNINWVSKLKYMGIVINSKLNWSDHCWKVVQKASMSLNRLCRAVYSCAGGAKSLVYKALVRPCMEYGSTVWSIHTAKNINLLESVQHRTARWIKSKYDSTLYQWSKSTDDCLKELKCTGIPTALPECGYASLYYKQSNSYKFLPSIWF